MTLSRLALVAAVAVVAPQVLLAQSWPLVPQPEPLLHQVALCTTTSIGTCGGFCEPFDCRPNYTLANPGETLRFDVGGGPAEPFVLFSGSAVSDCQAMPGFTGELGVFAPIMPLAFGLINDVAPPNLKCRTGSATAKVLVPPYTALGLVVRFQVLGINTYFDVPQTEFSRPTEIRIR